MPDANAVFLGRLDERLQALQDIVSELRVDMRAHISQHKGVNGEMRKLLAAGIAIGSVLTGTGAATVIKILGA